MLERDTLLKQAALIYICGYAFKGDAPLEEDNFIDGDMLLEGERTNR